MIMIMIMILYPASVMADVQRPQLAVTVYIKTLKNNTTFNGCWYQNDPSLSPTLSPSRYRFPSATKAVKEDTNPSSYRFALNDNVSDR